MGWYVEMKSERLLEERSLELAIDKFNGEIHEDNLLATIREGPTKATSIHSSLERGPIVSIDLGIIIMEPNGEAIINESPELQKKRV